MAKNSSGPSTRYTIQLGESDSQLSGARVVEATGGLRAAASFSRGQLNVELAIPDTSVAEVRWSVDKVLRALRGSFGSGPTTLRRGRGVAANVLEAVALDLNHATKGRLKVTGAKAIAAEVSRIGTLEDGFRAWVNEDPSTRTSLAIARDVQAFAAKHSTVTTKTLTEGALKKAGLNLLLAVGAAAEFSPPRLITAKYTPKGKRASTPPLMLLGKGITFDTGGINVKPYESYVSTMKNDMAGSALAWHLFTALVEKKFPHPLVVTIAACENAIGQRAMRPGSLVKSYRGPTVRIDHTDAEGRLALADGLAWASDHYKPHKVISFATLTTSALISYGPYATPVHFADADLHEALWNASKHTGEDLHFFPERIWHFEANRDKEADLRNTARLPGNAARGAGSRNAAHFLKHFATTPLVHLDIFGSTWNWAGDAPGSGYGATGAPLRTVLRALESLG